MSQFKDLESGAKSTNDNRKEKDRKRCLLERINELLFSYFYSGGNRNLRKPENYENLKTEQEKVKSASSFYHLLF